MSLLEAFNIALILIVAAAAAGRFGARRVARGRARRARGPQAGQVPRDTRRRARLPHRQALRARLARARPHTARRGGGRPQAPGPPRGRRRAATLGAAWSTP